MSLINDVLKDLERRRGEPSSKPSPLAAPPTHRAPLPRWPMWLLAAVATGVALHWSLKPLAIDDSRQGPLQASVQSDPDPEPRRQATAASRPAEASDPDAQIVTDSGVGIGHERPERAPPPATIDSDTRRPSGGRGSSATIDQDRPRNPPTTGSEPADEPATGEPNDPGERPDDAGAAEPEAPRVSIQRARPENDRLDMARRAYADGRPGVAEVHLREVIEADAGSTEAFELLATILIRNQRVSEAESLLERGLESASHPHRLARLLGRLRLERGATAGAIEVLREHAPGIDEAAEHHLLLAMAHRQAGDHAAAADLYRRLSEVAPGRARVWLGLGVSLEALERFEDAASAYRRAAGGEDAQAAHYARQRLAAIERRHGEP